MVTIIVPLVIVVQESSLVSIENRLVCTCLPYLYTFVDFTVHNVKCQQFSQHFSDIFVNLFLGNLCMITGGRNLGRVGTIVSRERHAGSFDIVHIKDSVGHVFATRYCIILLSFQCSIIWSFLLSFEKIISIIRIIYIIHLLKEILRNTE